MSSSGSRGRGRPRKRPADEQRAAVLLAARHVFAAHGLRGATIEGIAQQAGVTRQVVYEQFTDRQELFAAVVADVEERTFQRVGARARDDSEPNLRRWAHANYAAMFDFVSENPDAMPVLAEAERTGEPALTRLRTRLAELYAAASKQRWAEHGIESGRTDTALATMYLAMTEALVNHAWQGDPPEREALVDLLTEFTIGGVERLRAQTDLIERLR